MCLLPTHFACTEDCLYWALQKVAEPIKILFGADSYRPMKLHRSPYTPQEGLFWGEIWRPIVTYLWMRALCTVHLPHLNGLWEVRMPYSDVARLPDNIPAHQALLCHVKLSVGWLPYPTWKHQPGQPRARWTDQLCRDNNNALIATLWRQVLVEVIREQRYSPSWLRVNNDLPRTCGGQVHSQPQGVTRCVK